MEEINDYSYLEKIYGLSVIEMLNIHSSVKIHLIDALQAFRNDGKIKNWEYVKVIDEVNEIARKLSHND